MFRDWLADMLLGLADVAERLAEWLSPSVDYGEIVTETLIRNRNKIADNVDANNAVLRRLRRP